MTTQPAWAHPQMDAEKRNRAYVDSGRWRCEASPTGAHHWRIDGKNEGDCLHCGAHKDLEGEITVSENNGTTKAAIKDFAYGLLRTLDETLEPKKGAGSSQIGVKQMRKLIYTELDKLDGKDA